jgi:H+/Cl- antiporter ClcA
LAVSALGSGVANVIAVSFHVDQRSHALYVQAGVAAAFSLLLPSPLLGLLLVQELRIATRPTTLNVSSAVSKRASVGGAGRPRIPQEEGGQLFGENDLLEQITIDGLATIASTATASAIVPVQWQSTLHLGPLKLEGRDFEYIDWLLAIPMGILGGITVILAAALYLKWNWSRCRGCQYLHSRGLMTSIVRQLFVVLAGLVFGMLGVLWSTPPLFENGVNAWQGVVQAHLSGISAFEVIHFGLHVIMGLAICLGCGLLGGPVFPMLVVGACLGVSLSSGVVPLNLTLPCCMAASLGGFIPAPFTVISTMSLLFDLDSNQTISVFIATMVASACCGGTGAIRCMGEYVWDLPRLHDVATQNTGWLGHEPETMAMDDDDGNRERPPSDFEILQGVRSALFGSPAPN